MNKQEAKKALNSWLEFSELCRLLFSGLPNCPYRINELKSGKWHKMAKELAKEMAIDWKNMDTAQSNAIMLAMLEDTYQKIQEDCEKDYIVTFTISAKEKANEVKENAASE